MCCYRSYSDFSQPDRSMNIDEEVEQPEAGPSRLPVSGYEETFTTVLNIAS